VTEPLLLMPTRERLPHKTKQGATSIINFGWHICIIKPMFMNSAQGWIQGCPGDPDPPSPFRSVFLYIFYDVVMTSPYVT
jgi:hypothetical protein